ncbi:oxalate decarboxylase [Gautieria morchelliformis]|nr:oxalate decarboxylase [Gautieria morchelliformis]
MFNVRAILTAVLLASSVLAVPANDKSSDSASASSTASSAASSVSSAASAGGSSTQTSSAPASSFTAGLASEDPNDSFFQQFQDEQPEPVRGSLGAPILGPQNIPLDRQSPDFLAPPSTDAGSLDNAKWPFSLSHNRFQTGGWARQQNIGTMPLATEMAGVNMRLEQGAIRELHWHLTAEWAYILAGTVRVTSVSPNGQNFEAEVNPGDIWYFPPGIPHSLQATNATQEGAEFLLVFDDGNFSEDDTFLLTDWLAHIPKEVLAKNFMADQSAFAHIPAKQLYIFPGVSPPPIAQDQVADPQGQDAIPLTFAWSKSPVTSVHGGTVKVIDSTTFTASKTIAAAEVTVEVGGMRELHWHPTQAEWSFFIQGSARMTIFAANGNARTFNYVQGDIGYVPPANGHYIENIGNDTLHFLEITKTDQFQDISLNQWLALTPPELVKAHLNIDDATINLFNKSKVFIV